ncbi:MAG: sugar transferase, partial [Pseudomonadota bacterium]
RADELAILAGLGVGLFAFGGLYRRSTWETDEIRGVVCGVLLLALMDATFQYALRDHSSRLWFVTAYPLVALLVVSMRMVVRSMPSVREAMTSHVVLLGTGTAPDHLIYELRESSSGPVKLLRSIPLAKVLKRDPQMLRQLIERLARHADVPTHRVSIVVAPTPDEIGEAQTTIALLREAGQSATLVLPFTDLARNGVGLRKVVGADMVMAELQAPRSDLPARIGKRLFDLVASSVAILLLAPVFAVLIALLTLEKGPVFFRQKRMGRDGRTFSCIKFRSMRPDAEDRLQDLLANDTAARLEWARTQKLQNDPRVTPIGDFLRRTSLDELPQIFNVL